MEYIYICIEREYTYNEPMGDGELVVSIPRNHKLGPTCTLVRAGLHAWSTSCLLVLNPSPTYIYSL
jgi:hypothetical protein